MERKSTSRRKFLFLAGAASLAGLGYSLFEVSDNTHSPIIEKDKWAFLRNEPQLPDTWDLASVQKQYSQLGPRIPLLDFEVPSDLEKEVLEAASKYGLSGIKPTAYKIILGMSENPQLAESLLEYCKVAINYLNAQIKGFDGSATNWTILRPGDNYSTGFERKGFIGNHCIEAVVVEIFNPANGIRIAIDEGIAGRVDF